MIKKEFSLDLESLESQFTTNSIIKESDVILKLNTLNTLDPTSSVLILKKLEDDLTLLNSSQNSSQNSNGNSKETKKIKQMDTNQLVTSLLNQQVLLFMQPRKEH